MPGRRPGPTCVTTADSIDQGTNCRYATEPPGPLGAMRLNRPQPRLFFSSLWANYPSHPPYVDAKGNIPKGFENQCAIKVSAALMDSDQSLTNFRGATVQVGQRKYAIRAEELATWLRTQAPISLRSRYRLITGEDWQDKIKGRSGIIAFKDYWRREGEKQPSGDHIDLWNGSRLTASGFGGSVVTALRFGLGVSSGPGYSDLGKAKRIEFWDVE